jgi:hypothetical protein
VASSGGEIFFSSFLVDISLLNTRDSRRHPKCIRRISNYWKWKKETACPMENRVLNSNSFA